MGQLDFSALGRKGLTWDEMDLAGMIWNGLWGKMTSDLLKCEHNDMYSIICKKQFCLFRNLMNDFFLYLGLLHSYMIIK